MKRTLPFLAIAFGAIFVGCFTPAPVAKISAESKLSPVVAAIAAFKVEMGRVPDTLEEVQAKRSSKLVLSHASTVGLVWSIDYQKKSSSAYEVSFHHVHYDLYYADGREVGWSFNPWR